MTMLTVSIVNWNTCKYLDKYIDSIYKNTKRISFEIIVADNNSSDNSVSMIKEKYPKVILIENKDDLYFVKATNQIMAKAKGQYILISTPDMLVLPNAFDILVEFMNSNKQAGATGAKLLNPDHTFQGNGERFPTFLYAICEMCLINTIFRNNFVKRRKVQSDWDRNDTREVDTVSGACLMVRKDVLDKVGHFDEKLLMYWEDVDLCYRIRKAGYKIYFCHEAQVMHHWGKGTKQEGKEKTEKIFNDSMIYYYRKYFGVIPALILKLIVIIYTRPVLRIIRFLKHKRDVSKK